MAENVQPQPQQRAGFWRDWRLFVPKSITVIAQEGYSVAKLRADATAGLTVAIVAVPLAMAMAMAIASGVTPAQGLITAVVGGFLISALGGRASRSAARPGRSSSWCTASSSSTATMGWLWRGRWPAPS